MFNKNLLFLMLFIMSCCNVEPPQTQQKYHKVQPGESLWIIAQKYRISLSDLISANPQIKNPDLIYPGQIIVIPR